MSKNVQIIEKSSGQIVAEYPVLIELGEINDNEYLKDAWENAVEEGLVEEENKNDYDIEIVEDLPPEENSSEEVKS